MKYNHLKVILTAAAILSGTTACSIKRDYVADEDQALKPGFARIIFTRDNHIPNLFREKLFGKISFLKNQSGDAIDIDPIYNSASVRFVDVLPGTYEMKANCDPVNNHSGDQYNWLVNYDLTIEAQQVLTIGCEYYEEEKVRYSQGGERKEDKTILKVKVVELDREYYE